MNEFVIVSDSTVDYQKNIYSPNKFRSSHCLTLWTELHMKRWMGCRIKNF